MEMALMLSNNGLRAGEGDLAFREDGDAISRKLTEAEDGYARQF